MKQTTTYSPRPLGISIALVMLLLLGSFRTISWIAQRVERHMQKQPALSSEYEGAL